MIPDQRPHFFWIIWGLVAVWCCLGSVAFTEAVNLWDETSAQDEVALSELASTLKSDAFTLEERVIHWATATITMATYYTPLLGVCPTGDARDLSTALRSHQAICIYRI